MVQNGGRVGPSSASSNTSAMVKPSHPKARKLAPGGGNRSGNSSVVSARNPSGGKPSRGSRGDRRGGGGRKSKSHSPKPTDRSALGGNTVAAGHAKNRSKRNNNHPRSKSKSPVRSNNHHQNHRRNHHHNGKKQHHHHGKHHKSPADMTVIVNRVDLLDGSRAAAKAAEEALQLWTQPIPTGDEPGGGGGGTSSGNESGTSAPKSGGRRHNHGHAHQHHHVAPYHFGPDMMCWVSSTSEEEREWTGSESGGGGGCSSGGESTRNGGNRKGSVAVVRAPHPANGVVHPHKGSDKSPQPRPKKNQTAAIPPPPGFENHVPNANGYYRPYSFEDYDVMDTSIPNPHPPDVVHDKYWAQRRRLFSRFDFGIQLDSEGWYSVTPEVIADHVAKRVGELAKSSLFGRRSFVGSSVRQGIVVLDAFCGCGGNSIAFGKLPPDVISLVVCVDVDRSKLRKAAHNASLYGIPTDKLLFVECNTLHVLERCYKDGERVLELEEQAANDSGFAIPSWGVECHAGFLIGGTDLLPPHVDAVFMDPPWGGIDYGMLGKNGYDLAKNMRIQRGWSGGSTEAELDRPRALSSGSSTTDHDEDFSDFSSTGYSSGDPAQHSFCSSTGEGDTQTEEASADYVDGVDLLKMAAAVTKSRLVLYDLPRNTNKTSLGQAALAAGYRGNVKLEEHFLNGRLKTVTAYLGSDYSNLLS